MNAGHRIILTRQRDRNTAWAASLARAGHTVVELPLIRYESLPVPGDVDPGSFDWILFTSPQGRQSLSRSGPLRGDRSHRSPGRRHRSLFCGGRPPR